MSTRVLTVGCTIRACNTMHDLFAHVELDGNLEIHPGDRVRVHGDPIAPAFGEQIELRREATITRAHPLARLWTRLTGNLGCRELVEVSFTDRRIP